MSYFTSHPVSGKALRGVHLHGRSDPSCFDNFFLWNYEDFIVKIETVSPENLFNECILFEI